jgi:hypothetical protein
MPSVDDRTVSRLGAALRQARSAVSGGAAPMVELADLDQEAAIAAWRADAANVNAAKYSPAERESYLRIRRHGAMLDAAAAAADRVPLVRVDEQQIEQDVATPDTQLGEAALLRACDAALALPDPLPLIFVSLLAGTTHDHLAAHLGVSRVRVTQLCARLRSLLVLHLAPENVN